MLKRLHAFNQSNSKPTTPQHHPNPTTHPELEELDARLKRITQDLIRPTPYILTVPSEYPYHLDPNKFHDWQRDTPFDEFEESLQYMSFLADWDDGLIRPVTGWEKWEHPDRMERTQSQQSAKSGVSGTGGGGAKKIKYSLSDYKKKAAGQHVVGEVRESGSSSKINGTPATRRGSSSSRQGGRGVKRSREDGEISEASEDIPLKQRRSSGTRSATPPRIPKLELPPDISPTLPPVFERELKRLRKVDSLDSGAKSGDQASDKRKQADKDVAPHKSDSVDRRKDDGRPRPKIADRASPSAPNGVSTKADKTQREGSSSGISKPRKIVKIRIPKSIRNSVKRLLKLPPRSQKKSESASKGVARKIERSSPHRDRSSERDKRRRDDESDGAEDERTGTIKRAKHPNNLDASKPNTPLQSAFRSPALSNQPSNQKPLVTSDPSGKTLTVPREAGGGASTPSGGHRNGTPTAPDSAERPVREAKPAPSRAQRSAAYKELRQVEKDMFTLGRASKHSSDRELNAEGSPSPRRVKRGLAFGLECILCFMLSYTVRDEMNRLMPPAAETAGAETWTTIFPYIQRIKRTALSHEHKHLQGLCLQLEAVCHLAAWTNEVGRAVAAPAASLSSSDQPSAASAPPSTAALMKHYHSAGNLFIDGARALSVDALQHHFPHTWTHKTAPLAAGTARPAAAASSAGGSNGAAAASSSSGSHAAAAATKFDPHPIGDFALPLTHITTGVEAVRAGRALLVEWCERQKLDWTPSLGRKKKD